MEICVLYVGIKHGAKLVLIYEDPQKKTRFREFDISAEVTKEVPVIMSRLSSMYPDYFSSNIVSLSQVQQLVQKVKDLACRKNTNVVEDLNRVSEWELRHYKAEMNVAFEANRILPQDPRYQHDVRVQFEATEPNDWDD
eukprot:TRINITY_DN15574_c0_g1_i1.p1 TRINITY_DN15574_c0_g1~~TRINITY_DN15574_c0_g1_i1.p1  ORF type:complete len:139 (-),score=23.25 TRINITY_DN15574_c0_g1_i1:327-743(-)